MNKLGLYSIIGIFFLGNQVLAKGTVGDYLKNISRDDRGSKVNLSKSSVEMPKYNASVFGRGEETKIRNLESIKPPKTSSFYGAQDRDQIALEKMTDESIRELYKLTQKFKTSQNRGELWLRLAELYVEKARIIEYRKQGAYDRELKSWLEKKQGHKPELDIRDAQEFNRKAIQLYEWFIRDFPRDSKIDQALFFLGYNHFEIGNLKTGEKFYRDLTEHFPKSPYVNEAHFALGEFYFENEKWRPAYEHYVKVIRSKKARLYTFSVYKAAWCLFRMGESQEALKYARSVIGQKQSNSGYDEITGAKAIDTLRLEKEALRDLVVFYAEAASYEDAPRYFRDLVGKDEATSYLEKLAFYYSDKGDRPAAKYIFKELISANPNGPKACEYQYQIVVNYAFASKSKTFFDELMIWITDYSKDSVWAKANANNVKVYQDALEKREKTLRNYVLQQHETAQNSRAQFSQQAAYQGYRLYIKEFADAPKITEMRFFYGELLYDFGEYDLAAGEYQWVTENGDDPKYKTKAALNMLLALEKNLPDDKVILAKVGNSTKTIEMDAKSMKFKQGVEWYLSKFPNGEKATQVRFRLGRLYYQHNQFDEAIVIFNDIVKHDPKSQYAEYSANLLLDIHNLRKDYVGLEKTGKDLLNIPGIAEGKVGGEIRDILEKSSFKKAQDLEGAKNYGQSADEFANFAKQNPRSPLAFGAQFNAAVNYEKAKKFPQAIAMYTGVINTPSKDEESKKKARKQLAILYQETGDYEKAAYAYQACSKEMANDPNVNSYHYNAAVIFDGLNKYEPAIAEYEAYAKNGKKADLEIMYYQVGEIWKRRRNPTMAIAYYEKFLALPPESEEKQVEVAYKISQAYKDQGKSDKERQWRQKTVEIYKKHSGGKAGPGNYYAAQARLEFVLETGRQFEQIKIPSNPAQQQAVVQKKIAMLESLRGELAEVIRFDDANGVVAALAIAGQASEHMSDTLINAPLPAGLTEEETKEYKAGIEKLALPFREKARDSYQSAVDKALQFDVFDKWTQVARVGLRRTESNKLPVSGEKGIEATEIDWMGLK